jgi:signal peptidase I
MKMPAVIPFRRILLIGFSLTSLSHAQSAVSTVTFGSMEPTLLIGDRILIEPPRELRRGDIVAFRFPSGPNIIQVKRLIGVPGDHIKLSNGSLILNSRVTSERYAQYRGSNERYNFRTFPIEPEKEPVPMGDGGREMLRKNVRDGTLIVPEGKYFVLGDNRDNSLDSRILGLIPSPMIVGLIREIVSSDDPDTKRPRTGRSRLPIERGSLQ